MRTSFFNRLSSLFWGSARVLLGIHGVGKHWPFHSVVRNLLTITTADDIQSLESSTGTSSTPNLFQKCTQLACQREWIIATTR
ncbi:hypothetical protein KC19_4G025900 [Ceratodon purpureus]|uniref:Uncharacterized protein n=1 Tax=Ceratodon purpureus TaxID=3225 RepID=A0A8T0I4I3_CERPU|nr:hypothetical protein KC19_4G025900 [Ceratodon purpureus]